MAQPTKAPLYQTDQSIRQYATTVTQVVALADLDEAQRGLFAKAEDATHVVGTAQTIFHAQGGGQPTDRGSIRPAHGDSVFHVSLVRQTATEADTILHAGSFSPAASGFDAGQPVQQEIDSAARDLHSRIHTGGHLIGLAVHALRDQIGPVGEGKANHYPDSALVEFIGKIAGEHKAAIQAKVDEYVARDLNVRIKFMDEASAIKVCTAVPDVIKGDAEGFVRVVEVEGIGAYPCGGTHLPKTKQVGHVEVRNIRRKNNISKITYSVT